MSTTRRRARLVAAVLTFLTIAPANAEESEVTVEVDQPAYDGLQALLDDEARTALAEGNYKRAWHFFWRLLEIDPDDVRALRESGRIANALGHYTYAVDALGRVDELDGTVADPELHYLRGESLYALGRKEEAEAEFELVEADLARGEIDRRGTLWLARIEVLRGDLDGALDHYGPLLDADPRPEAYAEVMLQIVEAHILCKHWKTAESLLRTFLKREPGHERAKALLAWVLEGRDRLDEELELRAEFADDWTDHPRKTLEYARALERAHEYSDAMDKYREARSLGVTEASTAISRLDQRLSPEIGGGVMMRTDPSGTVEGWTAGATAPLGDHLRLALSAAQETSSEGITGMERSTTSATAWALFNGRRGAILGVGTTARFGSRPLGFGSVGGSALAQSSPRKRILVQLRGDMNVPWRESASTLREDGVMDTLGAQLYAYPLRSRRILFSGGVQGRRLALAPIGDSMDGSHASQLFASAGLDLALWSAPGRITRSESFDNEMVAPRAISSSAVLSLRHYEMSSEDPFGARLVLVERARIDEVSGTLRHVVDSQGILGTEVRGGIGYDSVREIRQWRAGASLMLSATTSSRFTFDYDVASESATGLTGRRHIGSVVLHVDL